MIQKLLSLPPNLVGSFHDITGCSHDEYFCTNDPIGHKLGSGGGTTWLLQQADAYFAQHPDKNNSNPYNNRSCNGNSGKRIILHAGGQSRRLPSYAPSGKILTPIPVFRWERGQRLSQHLLSLQLPLYEQMMRMAPDGLNTMIVSGDVLIRTTQALQPIPDADVVCYGLWLNADIAKDHGVFVSSRKEPQVLEKMLQKPTVEQLNELLQTHYYLTDIGVWMLSDRALELLKKRSMKGTDITEYDLYGEFGCAMGTNPIIDDPELKSLKVAVVPLEGGEFYHFGTSREMISSMVSIQNVVNDQRDILHLDRKPHPSIFIQNAQVDVAMTAENQNIWIENSYIGKNWELSHDHIITGVPQNDWTLKLKPGECIDVVPIGEQQYCVRLYHIDDKFAGADQQKKQFPVVNDLTDIHQLKPELYLSAEEISTQANLRRLFAQRKQLRMTAYPQMAANWRHSVFYQLDLDEAGRAFAESGVTMPEPLADDAPLMTRIHDAMFRGDRERAFALLRDGLVQPVAGRKQLPRRNVYMDQIVWGRSPVRIDISGGWTDTPPYCLMEGGNVVNLAIELNGQQPIQTYVKPCKDLHIVLRSIDLGAVETVDTFEELSQYNKVGSPFSIPKAALALAGFLPNYCLERHESLHQQLEALGCGIEVTLLSAIPAGSGLGTSSVLAATVLGALNDFCGLTWDKNEIGLRTLALEQLLTTGGGWQDQFGGILGGVKLLQTHGGFNQNPTVSWLPDRVFTAPEYQPCHLLYYTGITRTAKKILAEIVRRMFLNESNQQLLLRQMKQHALDMAQAIQREDFMEMGTCLRRNWQQNQQLDSGTNPEAVRALTTQIDDLCLGYKLPGAGGGGYLYMVAKDVEAAGRIRTILTEQALSPTARFVDMKLSRNGLEISRS